MIAWNPILPRKDHLKRIMTESLLQEMRKMRPRHHVFTRRQVRQQNCLLILMIFSFVVILIDVTSGTASKPITAWPIAYWVAVIFFLGVPIATVMRFLYMRWDYEIAEVERNVRAGDD